MIADIRSLRERLQEALDGGPPVIVDAPPEGPVPPGTALVLRTSGSSTGVGRPVALSAAALRASASATHAHLAGPGRWVLALPPHHIAGIQVLVRSIHAGTMPLLASTGRFDAQALAHTLTTAPDDAPLYLSLVPTQLHRMLADRSTRAALGRCTAVLLGGAATSARDLDRARAAGIAAVTTYGMTETSGGCVYDGVPLPGTRVEVRQGRIHLGGPTLATGYLDDGPQPFLGSGSDRWFVTSDAGEVVDGRLQVLGRVDDVIVTGGVNVHPAHVEDALSGTVGEAIVVGVPDPEWGTLLVAVITSEASLAEVRDAVGHGPNAPRALVRVDTLPTRGPGKPDRRAATAIAHQALTDGTAERR